MTFRRRGAVSPMSTRPPESVRREAEPRLLARLPTLLALGVFDLFAIRDPALRNLVQDELASLRTRAG